MRVLRRLLFLCLITYFSPLYAWNGLGHMIIANVAYTSLEPAARQKIDELLVYFKEEYPQNSSFAQLASWPDTLRGQKIELFSHWHYIDNPYSIDGTQANTIDMDNAIWALKNMVNIVQYKHGNVHERVRFLGFLAHVVGDLHQPLHTVSYISKEFPQGDRGGNLYFIRYKNMRMKLHRFWDGALNSYGNQDDPARAKKIASELMNQYPLRMFGERAADLDSAHWAEEGMLLAKSTVYTVRNGESVDVNYVEEGRKAAQQSLTLAGYRLAALLNRVLT